MRRFESKAPIVIAPEPCWSCGGTLAFVDEMPSKLLRLRCAAATCEARPAPFRSKVREALRAWYAVSRAEARTREASKAMRVARAEA